MLAGKRFLVIEDEFLIALDIQRILETAQASATFFARSLGEAEALDEKLAAVDLAIVEIGPDSDPAIRLVTRLLARGIAVVFSTPDAADRQGFAGLPPLPVVVKPFAEADLLCACEKALQMADGKLSMSNYGS
jgi:DNA-binding response OmpR family regulator